MKTRIKHISGLVVWIVFTLGCSQPRNYYEDVDDPNLSRFTSRGYGIVTFYLNDTAYINPYQHSLFGGFNSAADIQKIQTNGDKDTLAITWHLQYNNRENLYAPYSDLSILIPIDKNFGKGDFRAWEGIRFPSDSTAQTTIRMNGYNSSDSGPASIYFVKLGPANNHEPSGVYSFSGLFEGDAGNNIRITKGRFDFHIDPASFNF